MVEAIRKIYEASVKKFIERRFSRIIEINKKYSEPKIKMTPMVSFSLLFLRFYLLLLVGLLFYKFWTIVTAKGAL